MAFDGIHLGRDIDLRWRIYGVKHQLPYIWHRAGCAFYQVLKSLRTALVIGLVPTLVTLPLGIALGLSAGYFRGKVDDVIQYLYTTVSAIPGVLLIMASVLSIQVMIDNHQVLKR